MKTRRNEVVQTCCFVANICFGILYNNQSRVGFPWLWKMRYIYISKEVFIMAMYFNITSIPKGNRLVKRERWWFGSAAFDKMTNFLATMDLLMNYTYKGKIVCFQLYILSLLHVLVLLFHTFWEYKNHSFLTDCVKTSDPQAAACPWSSYVRYVVTTVGTILLKYRKESCFSSSCVKLKFSFQY